jgi:putative NADH-flavin reductase
MKLVVLGATGGTGHAIVRQALEHGHRVTAFVRAADRLKRFAERIDIIQGDLLDRNELRQVIEGHDAVLSGFGPRFPLSKAEHDLLRRFAVVLTSAMQQARVRRVVVQSTAFLFRDSIVPPAYLVGRLFFPATVADASLMEDILRRSGLDWTIVRPPRLTDKPRNGSYRVGAGHLPIFGFTVSRADVADFMIKAVENRSSIGEVVGVCN